MSAIEQQKTDEQHNKYESKKKNRVAAFFIFCVTVAFVAFICVFYHLATTDRKLPAFVTSKKSSAIRGNIVSADGYVLAASQKLYRAEVYPNFISPDKEEMFIDLYSIYSGDDKEEVRKKIEDFKKQSDEKRSEKVVLSEKISPKIAEDLKVLSRRLSMLKVFIKYKGLSERSIDIIEHREKRVYPYNDTLSPLIGHIRDEKKDNFISLLGMNGIERYYEDRLAPIQDFYLRGNRDISNTVILNGNAEVKQKIDGQSIELSIPIKLQKSIEKILDNAKRNFHAKEIISIVMRSDTGEIMAFATSNRYNINSIQNSDIPLLRISAAEDVYEPGSVMKPIVYAILLQEDKLDPKEMIKGYGGTYKIGEYTIKDEIPKDRMTAEEALINSSNIGMFQLGQRLDGVIYHRRLAEFGLGKKTDIDLSVESTGTIGNAQFLSNTISKGTASYGYGINVNFIQLIQASNVFNNNGVFISPKIASYIVEKSGKKHKIENEPPRDVLTEEKSEIVKNALIKVAFERNRKRALVEGVEIGGKTGTARIASNKGGYKERYNSSFIGFANDKEGNKYTIGVLVVEPTTANNLYYGAQSAMPTFKKIVEELVEQDYLKRDLDK
ncbi:MAG: penicillin-binding protein 2 [Campylobacteraceae bacterium]|jgi:cell division protein FtsI (penicillin-binding protein 3)|nr:penicillin-binding protein 2 [Campylobacteraceae bacterium]